MPSGCLIGRFYRKNLHIDERPEGEIGGNMKIWTLNHSFDGQDEGKKIIWRDILLREPMLSDIFTGDDFLRLTDQK